MAEGNARKPGEDPVQRQDADPTETREWLDALAAVLEREGPERLLAGYDGILVPGGFGERGIEGKIDAIRFARELYHSTTSDSTKAMYR